MVPIAGDGIPVPNQLGEDGKPVKLPDGTYTYKVVAMRGGETVTDARALAFDSVASVTTNAKDGVKLNLPVKGVVTMADIKQVL